MPHLQLTDGQYNVETRCAQVFINFLPVVVFAIVVVPATSVVVVAIEFVVASAVDQPDILKYVGR